MSGRVVDEAGRPVPHVGVAVLQEQYIDGRKQLYPIRVGSGQTNERGEFQFSGVWTGPVVLQFMPWRLQPTPTGITDAAPNMAYFTTYYPATMDVSQAARIELAPGTQRSGLEGVLLKARVNQISGKILDHTGQLAKNWDVTLLPISSPWGLLAALNAEAPNGSFKFQHVPPGPYRLIVSSRQLGMAHRESITLESLNISNLDVRLPSPVQVEGEILVRGDIRVDPRAAQVSLWMLDYASEGPFLVPQRMIRTDDAKFAFENRVLPGKYRITASIEDGVPPTNIPESVYVERIQYGDQEVTDAPIEITARPSRIRVTLNSGTGSVTGIVMKNNAVARQAMVLLLSADKRRRLDQVAPETARTDQHGRFTIEHIKPGDYLAFAFEETERGFWKDEERFEKFASRAKVISIARNGATNVNLQVTPLPEG